MKYKAWIHWIVTEKCVNECAYCLEGLGGHSLTKKPVGAIDIPRLIQTLDNSGLTFKISFTGGGEPFLVPNLAETCQELTKKHYIAFNTNLVEGNTAKLAEAVKPERVTLIYASLHFESLERRGLLMKYIENYSMFRENGFQNLYAVSVAYPPLMDKIEIYKELFHKHGIEFTFSAFKGKYNGKEYPESYSNTEIAAFGIESTVNQFNLPGQDTNNDSLVIGEEEQKESKPFFCNAGYNAGVCHPNGNITICQQRNEPIGHIYEDINFRKMLTPCSVKSCICPLFKYDSDLYNEGLLMHQHSLQNKTDISLR
jgi:MoaA/NifB/PqqE/SkfB family radical SAM enzyme